MLTWHGAVVACSVAARDCTRRWAAAAKRAASVRAQGKALQAFPACSDDEVFFQSWGASESPYAEWCGVEANSDTMAVTKLMLASRLLKVRASVARLLWLCPAPCLKY